MLVRAVVSLRIVKHKFLVINHKMCICFSDV
jgi:hypothetical protein